MFPRRPSTELYKLVEIRGSATKAMVVKLITR